LAIMKERWLHDIAEAFDRLRKHFDDYAKLALAQDAHYQDYSPFVNKSQTAETKLGFLWDFEMMHTSSLAGYSSLWVQGLDRKLGLWEHRRLERLLRRTRLCTRHLVQWVPMILETHPRYRGVEEDTKLIKQKISDDDAKRLDLYSHIRIRCIAKGHEIRPYGILLRDAQIFGPEDASCLSPGELEMSGTKELVLFETKQPRRSSYPDGYLNIISELLQLACLLREASSRKLENHTLRFRGILDQQSIDKGFAFVFEYPDNGSRQEPPLSLHSAITKPRPGEMVSLQMRFQIAQTLCKTIAQFHADGWVHKNISSHSVVFFHRLSHDNKTSTPSFDQPFLVDFEYARPAEADTEYMNDSDLEKDIYRHPTRQGPPSSAFIKMHDIYSLGVVLLEIGLWMSAWQIYKASHSQDVSLESTIPEEMQETYRTAAAEKLPLFMGAAYAEAVEICLSDFFRDYMHDRSLGAIFMEKVVSKLEISRLRVEMEI
jgi:hypothetical protein